ncbi:L,D-transpeptidase-like protein [Chitinophaga niastensis]|uniref:L,D-transpeptidase-like protein n=1 Tax=Chitinophaga niastensis TaxID=536980 RepID=A0A2P8HA68_CHINA|nr:murein L,D-transpeptidase catalytic domain family protein [Chitinophaga niastensis]PSL43090.1 L,D-transpeptidase-like protein [Chitinophaga niastensis]
MLFSKLLPLCFAWLLFTASLTGCKEKKTAPSKAAPAPERLPYAAAPDKEKLHQKVIALREYAQTHGYSTRYAFFIDFGVFSGGKRFICYDLEHNKTLSTGLVAHGQGPDFRAEVVPFSNEVGSLCSSLGKYRIGTKYSGRFGTAYKLHGLDKTNSNAFDRFVVLHSHVCVPGTAQDMGICRSDGCPTLNPAYFATLQPYLDQSDKPVLLWIYH